MPRKRGTKRENVPTYKTKLQAVRHGYITYGKTKTGARKFKVYKATGGWNVVRKR